MFSLTLKTIRAKQGPLRAHRRRRPARCRLHGRHARPHRHDQADLRRPRRPGVQGHRRRRALGFHGRSRQRRPPAVPSTPRSSTRSGPCPASPPPSRKCSASRWSSGHDGELLDSSRNRAIPIGMAWQTDDRINPMELVDGAAPAAANEIVIDQRVGRQGRLHGRRHRSACIGQNGARRVPARRHRDLRRARTTRPVRRSSRSRPRRRRRCSARPDATTPSTSSPRPACRRRSSTSDLQTAIANPDVDVITGAARHRGSAHGAAGASSRSSTRS